MPASKMVKTQTDTFYLLLYLWEEKKMCSDPHASTKNLIGFNLKMHYFLIGNYLNM